MPKYYNKKTKKWEEGEGKKFFNTDRKVPSAKMTKDEMIADKAKKERAKNKGAGSNIQTKGKTKPKSFSPGSSKAGMSGKSGGSSSSNKLGKPNKKFNVGVSKGGVSFKEAFRHFRNKGDKTFTWNGKKYTTELKK